MESQRGVVEAETAMRALVEPPPPVSEGLEQARARLRKYDERVRQRDQRIEAAAEVERTLQRELEAARRRSAQVDRAIERTQAEIREVRTEESGQERVSNFAQMAIEAFGNSGIRSFLIENELPRINKLATRFARRLFGPGAYVRLGATRKLKTGADREELSIESLVPGCTSTYAKGSAGQRTRLDLCLLLALREVVAQRSGNAFHQFFADELFDGLDETGEDFVIELLRDLAKTCPVILVTHSARLKSIGDRTIFVQHQQKGVATVHDGVYAAASA